MQVRPTRPTCPHRRRSLSSMASLAAAMLLSIPFTANATGYPDKPITLVVPFGAGGITDLIARATGKALSEQLGQSVVVENRPGAGGNIAADFVRRARPDGYTLMFATVGVLAVNPHTDVKVNFDSAKDFTYISLVGSTPFLVVVGADVPANTLPALIKLAQRKPDAISVGTAGVGSAPYQGMRIFQDVAKVEFLHVPFKSGAESVTNVVSGQVNMTFEATPQVMPFVTSGKLRALAVASPHRLSTAPQVPSTAELGFPSLVSGSVAGLIGPAGLDPAIVKKLNAAVAKVAADPKFKATLIAQGTEPAASSPEQFRKLISDENQRWSALLGAGNK
ncbi:ABC transporter substrate-binding protein [Cupriavidus sp. SHE]|uniref:Tripartite tricarboxylate transporter substrate binding protein n=1 Tax=Cupriavidus metallidurans TaxID=119219 RepID=A0A482IVU5_9BURK|nr:MULTISPECIES: tripartite tricarboxylate transporter substrate binding protein [Cupriavidus]KWR86129.1 ABC transporter substrate-binding protein [Cupriavidus sp. SHE]QBP12096.1 tripartite tricarboxylate transporter substrate binding protein [Cupriavidus metallidurans]